MKTSTLILAGALTMGSAMTPAQQTYPPTGYSDQSAYPSGSAQGTSPYPSQSPYPAQTVPNSSGQYPSPTPGYDPGAGQPGSSPYPNQPYPNTTLPSASYPVQNGTPQTYPGQQSYPAQQPYPSQPQSSPMQSTYPGQQAYPAQQGWTPPQPSLQPGQPGAQPVSKNCIVKLSTDRSTLHLMDASGTVEKKHLSLGSDRVQRVFNSPDGIWSVAVYKVRGVQQYGFIAFELAGCEDQMPVEIPAVATSASFESGEVVLGFDAGKSQRYPLKNARIQ